MRRIESSEALNITDTDIQVIHFFFSHISQIILLNIFTHLLNFGWNTQDMVTARCHFLILVGIHSFRK